MKIIPMKIIDANILTARYHRHHKPPKFAMWAIGLEDKSEYVGCAIVGKCVARELDNKFYCEILRLTTNGIKNGCSMLYGACIRIAREMGYYRVYTYILETEPGTSLLASGFKFDGMTQGGSWNSEKRPRIDKAPICKKQRWVKIL